MTTVTREHLAGLQYALMVAEENWPNAALTEILSDLIAQASAAPERLRAERDSLKRQAEHLWKALDERDEKLAAAQALLLESREAYAGAIHWEDQQPVMKKIDAFLSSTAQPAECQHRYMYFGTQPARRCADCNKVEPAEVKS